MEADLWPCVDPAFRIPSLSVEICTALRDYFTADEMVLPRDAYPPAQDDEESEEEDECVAIPQDTALENVVRQALARW
jgi:hypothetical protein